MPNTERQWARRELERAVLLIDWVGTHLNRVEDRYRALHPEIADPILACMAGLDKIQDLVSETRAKI